MSINAFLSVVIPVALLEGMTAGCTVITTNVSGCPETIGDAGFLIDFDDVQGLKTILLDLAADSEKREEYSRKSLLRLHAQFLWEHSVAKYLETMKKTM